MGVKVTPVDESCARSAVVDGFHLLSHCGVDLGTCQVNVLINLGLEGGEKKWDRYEMSFVGLCNLENSCWVLWQV